jgi:hypothetical protein
LSTNGGAPQPLAHYAVWNEFSLINQFGNGYRAFATNQFSFGMRVSGSNYADQAFGTVGRATMGGSTFGIPFSDDNITGGVGTPSIFLGAGDIPAGFSLIRASLFPNSLSTGAWSGASICFQFFDGCSQPSGSARSVAFRTFTNTGTSSVTFQANALLHGSISESTGGTGGAIGRVYLFDPTLFSNTLSTSGDAAQFLVGSIPVTQDITALFPSGTVLSSSSQTLSTPNQPLSAPLTTSPITLNAGQSVTVMFDVTTITPAGSLCRLFQHAGTGGQSFHGPGWQRGDTAAGAGSSRCHAGYVRTPDALARIGDESGGNDANRNCYGDRFKQRSGGRSNCVLHDRERRAERKFAVPAVTDATGHATFKYTDAGGAGTDSIQAAIGALNSNAAQITWTTPGPLDHITISPASSTIAVGGSQPYTAQGFDVFNNSLGDVSGV